MIRGLERIRDCGNWIDYSWDNDLKPFSRINLIYGPNGSGKTSLSNALDGLRNAEDQRGFERLSIAIDGDGAIRTTNGKDDAALDRVLVFSDQYVARNHSFTSGESQLEAVLTIGERSIEIEKQLEDSRSRLEAIESQYQEESEKAKTSRRKIDRLFGEISEQVFTAASRAGGRWRSRGAFSARTVRVAFDGSRTEWKLLSDQELQHNINIINSSKAERIPNPSSTANLPTYFVAKLNKALAASPSTILLQTLVDYPEATNWVDEGRKFHEKSNCCIYCGSDLATDRRHLIDQHFSDEVERLKSVIQRMKLDLSDLENETSAAISSIPSRGLFFEDLRENADTAIQASNDEIASLAAWVVDAKKKIGIKAANILTPTDLSVVEPPEVSHREIIQIVSVHNDRVSKHDSLVQQAAKTVELHYLKAAESEISETERSLGASNTEISRLEKLIEEIRFEISRLEAVDADPAPSAQVLTTEVSRLLGRQELSFSTANGKYHVTRDNRPAIGLSLGERTAITLVHFLEAVARFDQSKGKPIVIIDDPVSSLDSNVFMGVSTYIWSEVVTKDHIAQLFLLTHNFELFRQWDIQLEGLHRSKDYRRSHPASIYEIRSEHMMLPGEEKQTRHPRLVEWPSDNRVRQKLRSTYQHAFASLVRAYRKLSDDDSYERKLDAQLLYPNVIRRILETFLAFKHPEMIGDFTGSMRAATGMLEAANYSGDADALRLRLTRYLHAHSHSETPSTDTIVSPDEITIAISSVFEFMNCIDPDHFKGLCRNMGVDPIELVPTLAQAHIASRITAGADNE